MSAMGEQRSNLRGFAPALALLAVSVLINYIDRGNLSVAAPLLKTELRISGAQLGLLLAGFFWTYTALQFAVGWVVDRFDVNRVLAAGFLLWSLATVATGLVGGFAGLLLVRLILGVGESVAFPSYSKILAVHLPEHNRGTANAVISFGLKCGPAVGTFGAGILIARYGWRAVFVGIGVVSLLWLPAWRKWMPQGKEASATALRKPMPAGRILHHRSFWGAAGGHFCYNYFLYFLVMWLPFYLVTERHLAMTAMAKVAGVFYLVDAVSGLLVGCGSDLLIRRGSSPTLVRKAAMLFGHSTAAVGLAGCCFTSSPAYLAYLMIAGAGSGAAAYGIYAFPQTLAGPETAGKWVGLQNGVANLAGVVSPALAGFLLDWTGQLSPAFLITTVIMLLGGFSWSLGVRRVEPAEAGAERRLAEVAGLA
jgi:MFS transporter, ACS family, D-galactonate transporter